MKCSICGGDLEKGLAQIHGTWPGFFLLGFSYQPLFFRVGQGHEECLIEPDLDYEAFFCRGCKLVILRTDPTPSRLFVQEQCQSCGKPIRSDFNYCDQCGQRLK